MCTAESLVAAGRRGRGMVLYACYIAPQKAILFSDHLVILFVNILNVGRHREVSDDEGYACNMLEF